MGNYLDLDTLYGRDAYQYFDCYYGELSEQAAENILLDKPEGSFLVRKTEIIPDGECFFISAKRNNRTEHQCLTSIIGIGAHIEKWYNIDLALIKPNSLLLLMYGRIIGPVSVKVNCPEKLKETEVIIDILKFYCGHINAKNAAFDPAGQDQNSWKKIENHFCSPAFDDNKHSIFIRNKLKQSFSSLNISSSADENSQDIFITKSSKGGTCVIINQEIFIAIYQDLEKAGRLLNDIIIQTNQIEHLLAGAALAHINMALGKRLISELLGSNQSFANKI